MVKCWRRRVHTQNTGSEVRLMGILKGWSPLRRVLEERTMKVTWSEENTTSERRTTWQSLPGPSGTRLLFRKSVWNDMMTASHKVSLRGERGMSRYMHTNCEGENGTICWTEEPSLFLSPARISLMRNTLRKSESWP